MYLIELSSFSSPFYAATHTRFDNETGDKTAVVVSDIGPSQEGGSPKVEDSTSATRRRFTQEFKDE